MTQGHILHITFKKWIILINLLFNDCYEGFGYEKKLT